MIRVLDIVTGSSLHASATLRRAPPLYLCEPTHVGRQQKLFGMIASLAYGIALHHGLTILSNHCINCLNVILCFRAIRIVIL